jgi:hypothetical protein
MLQKRAAGILVTAAALAGIGSFMVDAGIGPFSRPTSTGTAPTIQPAGSASKQPQATSSSTLAPTPTSMPTTTPTQNPTPIPLSDRTQIAGTWRLARWFEAPNAVTLYVNITDGTLNVPATGQVSWNVAITEKGESPQPQPRLTCVGEVPLEGGSLTGIQGGNEKDWTSDLQSIRESLLLGLCGWWFTGESAAFALTHDGTPQQPAANLEMANSRGTYVWER